jgi:Na+-translocating ferredoxin:NAD+ oxidoreductase RnfD subunit
MKTASIKIQLIIFLGLFAIYLAAADQSAAFLVSAVIAVIPCVALDCIIAYIREKRLILSESPIISGLIIAYVLSLDQPWWMIVLAAVLAIISKHIIRFRGKHIFNPAAFGIFMVILLFGTTTQWRGTYIWYILMPPGLYFAYRLRKLEVLIGYVVTALFLFGIQALTQGICLFSAFGYLSYFYIFVMVVEPKTTPITPLGKIIFGSGAATLIFILTEAGAKFDVELFSLLGFNILVPVLNSLTKRRQV